MKASIGVLWIACLTSPAAAGEQVTNFKLQDLDNQTVELAELLRKGPVLLDFWATWCKPCLGVNEDSPRNQAKVKPFVKSLKTSFRIVLDKNNELMRRLSVRNLPTSILVSTDGEVIATYVGYSPTHIEDLEEMISEIFDDGN
jgi:thioredoxin-like negative regulator of GroEL